MAYIEGGLRIRQLLDVARAVLPVHQYRIAQVQHLLADTAYQERKGTAALPIRHDGWLSVNESRTDHRSPGGMQTYQ